MGNQQGKERRDYGRKIDWANAERPSPPGKPYLVPEESDRLTDVITIRWSPPISDGGAPIIGYLVEHRRTGSAHWLRATPHLVEALELPLTGLEPGWRYQFRVSAENDIGRSEPGELSEPLTVTPQKWAACAPFFNVELQDTIGLENEKVEFRVQVMAIPPPTIAWYKDGFEIFSSRRTKIVTENDQSTFIIHQAALEDEGEIKCTATNRAGYAVTKANLKLEAPPRIRLPKKYEDGLIFEKGELIRLKVTAAGRPKPEVSWYHNGELLQNSGKYEISDFETGSTIKITDACREDRGEYMIKGVNKIGEDAAAFLVTVTDRPSPPGKVQITIFGRMVTLTWSTPEDDGGCKIGSYIVEYFRLGWDMWLKARNCRQLSTILEDLIEGSEYKFRVRAENPYGISEPSEESDIIFIPDPKRGIFKPPPRKEMPELLKEPKRSSEVLDNNITETEEAKKRRLLEENARKLLDTPLSVLLPYENNKSGKRKTESSSESIGFNSGEEIPPPVPKRRHKGKNRLTPSPIDPELVDRQVTTPSPSQKTLDLSRLTPSPIDTSPINIQRRTPSPVLQLTKVMNGTIPPHDESEGLKKSNLNFEERDVYNIDSPMYPRENDDSIMHGSSELMLVIYPRDRSKSFELSAQQRSEIEMSLTGEGVAPPMSLSAPELGCNEIFELPMIRNAVSSSELLYEKTMARLYQDSIEEESQKTVKRRYSLDRKSVERRASFRETLLERRLSLKENYPEEMKLETVIEKEKSPEKSSKIPVKKTKKSEDTLIPKPRGSTARERLSSVEKEQLEFALVRERLKQKEENSSPRLGRLTQQQSDTPTTTPTTTSSSMETEEFDDEYEDDEDLEDEEEEDYLDELKKEDGFKVEDDGLKPLRPKTSPNLPDFEDKDMTKPVKIAPYAEQEEDTYHPRSMIPTRSVFNKVEKPEELKLKTESLKPVVQPLTAKVPESPVETEEKPIKTSKIPVVSPTKSKKTSKILKKFGLKKDKKVPEVTTTPVDPNQPPAVVPKPILKNKIPVKKKDSPKSGSKLSVNKLTDKSVSEEESESEVTGRKKKVRISEPNEKNVEENKKDVKPVDVNAVENQVLIYHYSDIVKEFGGHKKPPSRLYLNYDELKAHAKSEEPEKISSSPKLNPKVSPSRSSTPSPKQSPRPSPSPSPIPQVNANKIYGTAKQEELKPNNTVELETPKIVVTTPEESLPKTAQQEKQSHSTTEYLLDVVMFIVACWLYLFKNELYAIPVLCIMAYRQLKDMTVEKYTKIKNSISNRIPERLRGKTKNEEKIQ